jgi:hypothetical protein
LQEIPGIGSSGKSSPGRGGRRRRSAEIREGEAGSGGRRRRSGCGEWRGGSSTRERGRRGVKNRFSNGGRAAECARRQRDREGKKGGNRGSRAWGCHAARRSSWGPVPTGGWRRQQPARGAGGRRAPRAHARSVGDRAGERADRWVGTVTGGGVADRRGWTVSGTGRARARARARVGRPERRKELGRPTAQYRFGIV